MSVLAAFWLLLTLGVVLPSATVVDHDGERATARLTLVDQARAAVAIDAAVTVDDGDRRDGGPDGDPLILAGGSVIPRSTLGSPGNLPPRSRAPVRDRISPFEARAPPLG